MAVDQIAAKMGIQAIKMAGPTTWSWMKTKLTGRSVLVVGPTASGKTRFVEYLATGELFPHSEHLPTRKHRKGTGAKTVGNKLLVVSKTIDSPGQQTPRQQAEEVIQRAPNLLIVLTDMSTNYPAAWLNTFLDRFHSELQSPAGKKAKKRLTSIAVLLNKRDKASTDKMSRVEKLQKKRLLRYLMPVLGEQCKAFPVLPCVLISHERYHPLIQDAIKSIAYSVREILKWI